MNPTQFIIRRKTLISMLFVGLTLLGYVSYKHLPVELYPNAELPVLIVQVSSRQEVDPSYMEKQGIIPLEGAVGTLGGIEKIESFAEQQRGVIFVYYTQNTNIKYAYLKLQEKVDAIKSSLPEDFSVNVVKIDTERMANQFMGLEVRGSGGADRVRNIVDQKIVTELENIDGIANVEVFGGKQKSVEIVLNEEACRAHGITAAQIRALIGQNGQVRTFVGQILAGDKRYFVNVTAEYRDLNDLRNIVVRRQGPVLLKDVADIFLGVREETSISRVNGKDAVTVQLIRDSQVNLIDLNHVTQGVISRLNDELRSLDVEIVVQSNVAEEMERNISLIIRLALIGGCLAVFILWIFLRNFKLVITIALAIPISIFTAFNFFYAYDISINSLTLVGMALAVGMLLDNSVVVLENMYRLASRHRDADTAVVQGTKEVWRSIFAATLTTVTVFMPFVFSSNFMIRLIGRHIGVSIISTLLVSLLVALLLIPMLTHFFLKRSKRSQIPTFQMISRKNRLIQIYTLLLKTCVRFPARTVIGAVVVFFASIFICLALSLNVLRETETEEFNLYVTMPSGATLESTDYVVQDLEKRLDTLEEKEDVISKIYEEEAIVTINLKENYRKIRDRNIAQIKGDVQERIRGSIAAGVDFEQPQSSSRYRGGSGSNPGAGLQRMLGIGTQAEKVVIKGRDFDRMRNVASDIQYYLEDLSSVQSARLNVSGNRPEIHLLFDTQLISQYDIALNSIASELLTFRNEFESGLKFKVGTEEYDITIRNQNPAETREKDMDDLQKLAIPDQGGATHELQELSRIIYSSGLSSINRINQEKQIEVSYRFLSEVNDSKALLEASRREVDEVVAALTIPSGVAVEVIHEETDLDEFYFLIGAAFILIYMILASVFESFSTPVVMMFSIPLAAIGSFWALILTGNSLFNANTLTGFLILLGVVVNNGILLIDYTRILRRQGYRRSRALITAGQARLRPILITALTTIVAMFPLAMGRAEYVTTIGAPFAITVIGGLSLSTLFTLVFIPTLYSGLESALSWIRKLNWKVKILQLGLFLVGCWAIYFHVDDLVWKLADLFLVIILIPGLTYFVMTSLRRARVKVIASDEAITITIQNLVKIYDHDGRFVREWKKGKKIQERMDILKHYTTWRDFDHLVWQLPLLGSLIYFVYFYLQSGFWLFVLSHGIYFYVFTLLKPVRSYLEHRADRKGQIRYSKVQRWLYHLFFWGFPLFNLVLFQIRWHNIILVLLIGFVWYLSLLIYSTSNRLHQRKVNINRLKGRWAGVQRRFYQFVQIIPVIGKKKRPFRALNRVSLEIESGMFGLLGPNGAGKTTLMRIVCGILEQSYGRIWINGMDTLEKREELQGLIGYLPQEFGTYENMTAYEFLQYQAIMKNLLDRTQREEIVNHVLSAVHMEEHRDQKIGSFSGGMKQRIGIAQILLHLPKILVVDEPTAGLDPRERIRFRNLLVELSRERVVLFSTHIIEDISSSCNRVAVLNRGNLCYLGEPEDMRRLAEGHVWQFRASTKEFESLRRDLLVVHHMRDGDQIRVRCISENKPLQYAEPVKPSLEDAYIWLLQEDAENAAEIKG